jgi:hypothetical protein
MHFEYKNLFFKNLSISIVEKFMICFKQHEGFRANWFYNFVFS